MGHAGNQNLLLWEKEDGIYYLAKKNLPLWEKPHARVEEQNLLLDEMIAENLLLNENPWIMWKGRIY